jgi:hypothetical protein
MLDRSTFPVGSHRRADRTIRPTVWNYQKSYSPEGNEEGELHADLNRVITSFIIHYLRWQAGNKSGSLSPDSDYPLTGLLPRNAPSGISRPKGVCRY